jgi:L-lactate dehydrogenase (cytochrome)
MDLHARYLDLHDLKRRARQRLPRFVWEYLDSGTGQEAARARNRARLDAVGLMPSILHGEFTPDLSTEFLGVSYPAPFGVAPVGMSGLIWPDAEGHLARMAARNGLPYTLSTTASQSPEDIAPHLGAQAWFQLYPPRDVEIRRDTLRRAREAGFSTLVFTVDVPVASRRERQVRSGLKQPPKLTPRLLAQVAMRPAWAMGMARRGMPRMRLLDAYSSEGDKTLPPTAHVGYLLRTAPDWGYLDWLRDAWDGPLIVKGVLRPEDTDRMEQAGVDAIWVSNHAGRQFDGAPAAIDALPAIRAATRLPLVFDSGIEGGLDILRALALGADFVMMGRAWHYALAALGPEGPQHLYEILTRDMIANMGQLGAASLSALPAPVALPAAAPSDPHQSPLAR